MLTGQGGDEVENLIDPVVESGGGREPIGFNEDPAAHRPAGDIHRSGQVFPYRSGCGVLAEAQDEMVVVDARGEVAIQEETDAAEEEALLETAVGHGTSQAFRNIGVAGHGRSRGGD